MQDPLEAFSQRVNFTRYRGQPQGHYESYFVRANHPHRAQAFWIRYTIFSPKGRPADAIGELWAIYFDAEQNRHAVAKREYRFADCEFDVSSFRVRVGQATLQPNRLAGAIEGRPHSLAWDLKFDGASAPLLLLPLALYQRGFPAAKSVVSLPMARFSGLLSIDGTQVEIADWIGSQNHNLGIPPYRSLCVGTGWPGIRQSARQLPGGGDRPASSWSLLDTADHTHRASPSAAGIRIQRAWARRSGPRESLDIFHGNLRLETRTRRLQQRYRRHARRLSGSNTSIRREASSIVSTARLRAARSAHGQACRHH